MAAIGVSSVITKYSAANSRHAPTALATAYYPSKLAWLVEKDPGHDGIELLLAAADQLGFTVHLGGYEDNAWFNASNHEPQFLRTLATRAVAVSTELHARYGSHPSFRGLYDPQEPKSSDWPSGSGEAEWVADLYFAPVWTWARAHGYVTSTAPFWCAHALCSRALEARVSHRPASCRRNNRTDPEADAAWWDATLGRLPAGALTMAWLDDDQATNFWTVEGPIPLYRSWAAVAARHNVSVWSDCVDHNHTDQPQPIDHFVAQLKAEAPLVAGFTTFEWFFYLAPASGTAQKRLYDGYRQYLANLSGTGSGQERGEQPLPSDPPAARTWDAPRAAGTPSAPPTISLTFAATARVWVNSSTLHHDFRADYTVAFSAAERLVAYADLNMSATPAVAGRQGHAGSSRRVVYCVDGGANFLSIEVGADGRETCTKADMNASALSTCGGAGCFECVNNHGVVALPEGSGLAPPLEDGATFQGPTTTADGRAADAYALTRVIDTHGTNVTMKLRWLLARGARSELLEWGEEQEQRNATSGAIIASHNESHLFASYSGTPSPTAFGPTGGEQCGWGNPSAHE